MSRRVSSPRLTDWRKGRLPSLGKAEIEQLAESRARELAELALRAGYRIELMDAARAHRNMADFVRALHDAADIRTVCRPACGRSRER